MDKLVLVIHNIRSCHNVGSLLRSADGLGVNKVYLTGYTPYPAMKNDTRLPHLRVKIAGQIHKTALGAEDYIDWDYREDVFEVIKKLKAAGFQILALEQAEGSVELNKYKPTGKIALIIGNEVSGVAPDILSLSDVRIEIPMLGKKESFNVTIAAGIALYSLKYH
jgi:23S rRNA (guanosine2251-2'-O)-methyltransferase